MFEAAAGNSIETVMIVASNVVSTSFTSQSSVSTVTALMASDD